MMMQYFAINFAVIMKPMMMQYLAVQMDPYDNAILWFVNSSIRGHYGSSVMIMYPYMYDMMSSSEDFPACM